MAEESSPQVLALKTSGLLAMRTTNCGTVIAPQSKAEEAFEEARTTTGKASEAADNLIALGLSHLRQPRKAA